MKVQRQHLVGMLAGALLGTGIAGLGGALGYTVAFGDGLLWGAVVGGVLAGAPQFAQSGALLTQSENRILNTLVGLVSGTVLLSILVVLMVFLIGLFS